MSQRVVRYEGEGRARRLVYDYEGPSAPSSSDGLAALGRLSAIDVRGVGERLAGSNAPIERRLITEAERAVREEARPSPIAPRPAAARPSPAIQEVPIVTDTPPVEPESITVDAAQPLAVLGRLEDAAAAAREALEAKTVADLAWRAAQRDLAAAWRSLTSDPDIGDDTPAVPEAPANIHETIPVPDPQAHTPAQSRAAGTAGMLARRAQAAALTGAAAAKAGTNGSDAPGGGPGQLPPFLRRMVDALVESGGDRTAAAMKLGIKRTSLIGTLGKLRARTDLTADERAALTQPGS